MFKKKLKLCYVTHPYLTGYAKLKKADQINLAFTMGLPVSVDSATFEKIMPVAEKNKVDVYWKN